MISLYFRCTPESTFNFRIVSNLGDVSNQQQIQMVVQALPSKTKSTDMRPVLDEVLADVQARYTSPPYITITHAYYEAISMDEVPASPPATPNANYANTSDDYFQDQTASTSVVRKTVSVLTWSFEALLRQQDVLTEIHRSLPTRPPYLHIMPRRPHQVLSAPARRIS